MNLLYDKGLISGTPLGHHPSRLRGAKPNCRCPSRPRIFRFCSAAYRQVLEPTFGLFA